MKRIKIKFIVLGTVITSVMVIACSKSFLEKAPLGSLDPGNLANSAGVKGLLIGAYSLLDGFGGSGSGWEAAGSNWVYGGVASDDAYKGSDGGDQPDIIPIETYSETPADYYFNNKWRAVYDGVQRCNDVLRTMDQATDMSEDEKTVTEAQARFLRAHYHFEAQKMWNNVPWVNKDITYANGNFDTVHNWGPVWDSIVADFTFARDHLPDSWGNEKGRANKWAAKAYLAKAYMFQHNYTAAKKELDEIIGPDPLNAAGMNSSGVHYTLLGANASTPGTFFDNFNPATQNNAEGVFEYQSSVNDNSNGSNGNWGDVLNFPYTAGPGGCCGFYQPSQSLVNSYRVDPNGLPFLDTWNDVNVKSDQGLKSSDPFTPETAPLDSRLDWTVGRRGIPYLDWGPHPGQIWVRDQAYSGPYAPKKNVYAKSQTGVLTDNNFWTSGVTANDIILIRYADVLLWAAECEVEVGSMEKARTYVNLIRARAANPANWVKATTDACSCNTPIQNFNGFAANYKVGLYTTPWTDRALARKAVWFERKLEFAMEGHRFFDLQRYFPYTAAVGSYANSGFMADQINNFYLKYEKSRRPFFGSANFKAGVNEYFPIPQAQIDLSNGNLKQNPGY